MSFKNVDMDLVMQEAFKTIAQLQQQLILQGAYVTELERKLNKLEKEETT